MLKKKLTVLGIGIMVALLGIGLAWPRATGRQKPAKVVNLTESFGVVSVQGTDQGLVLQLRNDSKKLITAYSLSIGTSIMQTDFAPNLSKQGLAPGETEIITIPLAGKGPLTIGAIVFEDGSSEGDFEQADRIRDHRTGDRIQLQRIQALMAKASPEPDAIKQLKREINSLSDVPPDNNHSQGIRSGMDYARQWAVKMLERLEAGELDDQLKTAKGYNQRIVLPNGRAQLGLELINEQMAQKLAKGGPAR